MIMDLASALLSPQNRRLFKFHNLANPEQELLLETFKGTEALSWAFNYELLLVCEDSGVPLMMGQQVSIEIEVAKGGSRYIAYVGQHSAQPRVSLSDDATGWGTDLGDYLIGKD